jgi:hypothetical protein
MMKCDATQSLIEEYFDGQLDTHTASLVLTHIESCRSCNAELEKLDLEVRTYQTYGRGVDVSPALWANVRSRIAEAEPLQGPGVWERWQIGVGNLLSLRFNIAVSAALVLSAVVGTIVVMRYLDPKRNPNQIASSENQLEVKPSTSRTEVADEQTKRREAEVAVKGTEKKKHDSSGLKTVTVRQPTLKSTTAEVTTPSQLVRTAEQNYLSAIRLLAREVNQRPSQIDPETRAKLDGALASIDRTISATRKVVRKNPNDPLAAQYMLTAYAKKVDVLKEMTSY